MGKLEGKIAVITGGCGQVGYASANALANDGCRIIVIIRRDLESAQQMMDRLPNNHLNHRAVLADIKDSKSIKNAIASLDINRCDILINAAGRSHNRIPYKNTTDDIVDDIIDTNVKGTFYVIREFIDHLYRAENPIIINISSASSTRPGRGNVLYSSSKAAMDNMTKSMALQLAPKVRVISISPTILEKSCSGAVEKTEDYKKSVTETIPLKRIPSVEELAETILAVSTGLKYMTGNIISVDCGVSL